MLKWQDFFKDKHGRIVLAQAPNSPLIGWMVFTLLNLFVGNDYSKIHALFSLLSFGFIFTWAWLEITDGANYFRRTLGLLVLIVVTYLHLSP